MLDELMRQLASSFVGLVIGWFAGSAYCKRKVLSLVEHHQPVPRWSDSRFLGVILIVMALITTATASLASYRSQEQAKCFTDYNQEFVRAYTVRSQAADRDRAALNGLMIGLQSGDQKARAALFNEYVETVKRTDEERKRHPIPNPPDPTKYCDRR